jgi:hypothetical protein
MIAINEEKKYQQTKQIIVLLDKNTGLTIVGLCDVGLEAEALPLERGGRDTKASQVGAQVLLVVPVLPGVVLVQVSPSISGALTSVQALYRIQLLASWSC